MKKALVGALIVTSPLVAMAQSPLLTILNDGSPPSSDVALAMMAGFVDCDPVLALPRALADSGARFADAGESFAPHGTHSRAAMVLEPDQSDTAHSRPDPRGGFRHVSAMYRLVPAVAWPNGIRVLRVAQAVDYGQEAGRQPVESVTLTFNVPADVVRGELDKRFDGRLSARLGTAHRNEPVWFEAPGANNALRCLRQPDL